MAQDIHIHLVYRDLSEKDLEASKVRNGFEVMPTPQPGNSIIREGVLPGAFGFPDLHVTRIQQVADEGREGGSRINLFIIAYTNQPIDSGHQLEIAVKGFDFASKARLW